MMVIRDNAWFQTIQNIGSDQLESGTVLGPAVDPVFAVADVGYDGLICIDPRQVEVDLKILQGKCLVLIAVTAMSDPDGNRAFCGKIADPLIFQKLLLLAAAWVLKSEAELVTVGYIQVYLGG